MPNIGNISILPICINQTIQVVKVGDENFSFADFLFEREPF